MVETPSLTQVGLYLIGAGVVLALLGGTLGVGELGGLSGTFVFFGIVAVIIAAFRGGGGSQQQQQQVVVVQNGGASGAGGGGQGDSHEEAAVRCPECSTLNPVHASFCGQCGRSLGKTAQA